MWKIDSTQKIQGGIQQRSDRWIPRIIWTAHMQTQLVWPTKTRGLKSQDLQCWFFHWYNWISQRSHIVSLCTHIWQLIYINGMMTFQLWREWIKGEISFVKQHHRCLLITESVVSSNRGRNGWKRKIRVLSPYSNLIFSSYWDSKFIRKNKALCLKNAPGCKVWVDEC